MNKYIIILIAILVIITQTASGIEKDNIIVIMRSSESLDELPMEIHIENSPYDNVIWNISQHPDDYQFITIENSKIFILNDEVGG